MRVYAEKDTVNGGRDRLWLKFRKLPSSSPVGKHPYLNYVCSPNLERIRFRAAAVADIQ